jgi:ABC-2 type transport system permease protein
MSSWRLLISESALQTKLFFRSAVAAFFTLVFPLMFLVMINFFFGDEGEGASQYITSTIAVFGMVTATFTNLAITTSIARDEGVLKRLAGTPMPMVVHLGGRVISAVAVGLLSVTLMLLVGVLLFGVEIPWSHMPLFFLLLIVGAATFSALGLAIAAVTPNARAAPALANFIILPLAFISGIFFPLSEAPSWLQTVAGWFPLEPLASAAVQAFDPSAPIEIPWVDLAKLIVWGVVGMAVALRFFTYEPSTGGRRDRPETASVAGAN